jgi:hypothetical protein
MFFALYMGGKNKSGGKFTKGRIYLAGEGYHHDAVKVDDVATEDDEGRKVQLDLEDGTFTFLEEVFAVWLGEGPRPDGLNPGEVCVLDDAYLEGDVPMVNVKSVGYRKLEYFEILDHTNMYPGVYVQDNVAGEWREILYVDDCFWFLLKGMGKERQIPTGFSFALGEYGIVTAPSDLG